MLINIPPVVIHEVVIWGASKISLQVLSMLGGLTLSPRHCSKGWLSLCNESKFALESS